MSATLLHLGSDPCHRIAVLKKIGYEVIELPCRHQPPNRRFGALDGIVVNEDPCHQSLTPELIDPEHLVPRILFQGFTGTEIPEPYDLVVPVFTNPANWVPQVRALIARSQQLQSQSKVIRSASAALRDASACLREESGLTQESSVRETQDAARRISRFNNDIPPR